MVRAYNLLWGTIFFLGLLELTARMPVEESDAH